MCKAQPFALSLSVFPTLSLFLSDTQTSVVEGPKFNGEIYSFTVNRKKVFVVILFPTPTPIQSTKSC